MKLASLAFRNIRRNHRRSLLSASAITIAALVIVFMFALEEGMMVDMKNNIFRYITGHLRIRHSGYDALEELNPLHLRIEDYRGLLESLKAQKGIAAAAPRIQFITAIYRQDRNYNGVGLGVDFAQEADFIRPGKLLTEGRLPEMGKKEMLLSAGLAREIGLREGEKITLLTKNMYMGMSGMTFQVTGIASFPFAGFNNRFFLIPLDIAQDFLKMGDSATEILVLYRNPQSLEAESARTAALLNSSGRTGLEALPWTRIGTWFSIIRISDITYLIMGLFFLVLAATVIMNTTMMVIYERVHEIGTVAALGMERAEIVRLFFLEAFFISVLASAAGVLLGIGLTIPMSINGLDFSSFLEGMDFEISPVLYPILNWKSTLFVFIFSVGVASLASFLPSLKASRISPVEALRRI